MGASTVTPFGGWARLRSITGSRTHPWLIASPPRGLGAAPFNHGFADSPVALLRQPLRGLGGAAPLPASRGLVFCCLFLHQHNRRLLSGAYSLKETSDF